MKRIVFLSLLLFVFFGVFAEEESPKKTKHSLSGFIKDAQTGETLFGATVFLEGTSIGTITNEYGFFSLTAPQGNYTLRITYVGYTAYQKAVVLNQNKKFEIDLEENTSQLNEVTVIADDTKRANIEAPIMSVNKFKAATIKRIPAVLGEVDVIKAIQLLPGVTNSGEGASGFNVRGGAEDQNLVLLDEGIIYNSSHLFGFFSVFNNDAIKDMKLYKGGIPSKFGGRGSAVLDIRQKDGNKKDYHVNGGIGAISSRLMVEGPLIKDKASFLLAGRSSYAHLFLNAVDFGSTAYFYDTNGKLNFDLNANNKLFVSGYYGKDLMSFSGMFENSYGNVSGNIRWNHIFSDQLFSNLSLIYSKYDYNLTLSAAGLDWTSFIKNTNLKYDLKYYMNDKFQFDFGISALYYDFNPGEISPTDEFSEVNAEKLDRKKAFEGAAYMSAEHKISPKLTAQYGLRYSGFARMGAQTFNQYENNQPVVYNSKLGIYERGVVTGETVYGENEVIENYFNFEPRFSLSYQLNQKSSLKVSYNRMAQYVHLISNTVSATPLDVWAPSGDFIQPQIVDQYALGFFKNFKDEIYSIEVEAYYKKMKNRIDYINGADLIAQNTIETEILNGEARSYGLELLLKKNQGRFTGWLAYTLSKSEQRTPGGSAGGPGLNNGNWYNAAFDRTHDISLTGNYKLNDKWSLGANFAFQTGRPVTYPNAQYQYHGLSVPSYTDRNAERLPAYHRLDLSATLIPKKNKDRKWKGEWVFSIYNVYNRSNAASITFGQNSDTGINEATKTSIFGIIPSVTYNFKF